MLRACCALALIACSSPAKPTPPLPLEDPPERFDELAYFVANHLHRIDPAGAVALGHHQYDGLLPDRSPSGLSRAVAQLEHDRRALDAARGLTDRQTLERDVLVQEIRSALFDLVDRDVYRTNPIAYSNAINLDAYLREYGPPFGRVAAVIRLCGNLRNYLEQARANLRPPFPRTWLDTALIHMRGYRDFADRDLRTELARISLSLANQAQIDPALDTCIAALGEHVAWLEQQLPAATDAYALGEARFMKMLAETQGVDTQLGMLVAIGEHDLERNLSALAEAARAIDPARTVAEVVAAEAADRPHPSEVIAVATKQSAGLRAFVVENQIVTIPSDAPVEVHETLPFARWNSASLNSPGAFESDQLPSYFYISPPDPSWPADKQRAYIPPREDLQFTAVHEVWPGHFVHFLHVRRNPSRVLKSFCTMTMTEGWAHYTEEMMFDAGVGKQSPRTRIGMLKKALLRNVRYLVALGEHTRGMSVDDAQKLFETKAFLDSGNARQQAVRGTFDPMYLAYTLGKVMIRNLRADWRKRNPHGSLQQFHDALLSHGCAPIPLIRRAMLGPDAGSAL